MSDGKIIVADKTNFLQLNEMNLSKFVEQKGNYDYLPWSDGHELMKKFDENSDVIIREFKHYEVISGEHEDFLIPKDLPYQKTGNSAYVEVSVVVKQRTETEIYPVLDYANKDVADPTMSQVNKALKRAFVKALAKHGLGLYIYRGEDLPSIPLVGVKELERAQASIEKLNEITGTDMTDILINKLNEWTNQSYPNLEPINELKEMTVQHYGLIGKLTIDFTNAAEKKLKAQKKEAKEK